MSISGYRRARNRCGRCACRHHGSTRQREADQPSLGVAGDRELRRLAHVLAEHQPLADSVPESGVTQSLLGALPDGADEFSFLPELPANGG